MHTKNKKRKLKVILLIDIDIKFIIKNPNPATF